MKKQIRKAMICTIAMMLMGIVSLTGVTYAWFTQSDTAVADGINVGIVSKEGGVVISNIPNPVEWAYRVGLDINATGFAPASTAPCNLITDGSEAGRLKFYNGVINEAAPSDIYTEGLPVTGRGENNSYTQNGYYIEKDLYFYNDDVNNKIRVTLDKDPTTGTLISGTNLKNVDYAMRLAVVKHGEYTLGAADIAGANTIDSKNVQIFEFNPYGRLGATPANQARPTYAVKAESKIIKNGELDLGSYFDVAEHETYVSDGYNDTNSDYLEEAPTVYNGGTDDISFEIQAGKCYRVTIYIWLEGQDHDCKNAISGSDMDIQIGFKKSIVPSAEQGT